MTTSRRAVRPSARPAARRGRAHSLAPEHIGEAGSAAAVALAVGGVALFIVALSMLVGGLTAGARYQGGEPPPDVGQLGLGSIAGGIGLVILSLGLVGSSLAVFMDVPRARLAAAVVGGIAALLAAVGVVLVMAGTAPDVVLASGLAIATLVFATSAMLLRRPR